MMSKSKPDSVEHVPIREKFAYGLRAFSQQLGGLVLGVTGFNAELGQHRRIRCSG